MPCPRPTCPKVATRGDPFALTMVVSTLGVTGTMREISKIETLGRDDPLAASSNDIASNEEEACVALASGLVREGHGPIDKCLERGRACGLRRKQRIEFEIAVVEIRRGVVIRADVGIKLQFANDHLQGDAVQL